MDTYYLTLRPSSLNRLYSNILKMARDVNTNAQIFPTKGSIIIMAFQTRDISPIVEILDKWDLEYPYNFIDNMEMKIIEEDQTCHTIVFEAKLNPNFEEKLSILHKKISEKLEPSVGFPGCFIVYRGNKDIEIMNYIEKNLKEFNKGEWLITINKQGSAPLYIKDR